LVPANWRWCLSAGKVTVGLESHWPRVTDISGSPPKGSRPGRGRWAPAYTLLWSTADFTFFAALVLGGFQKGNLECGKTSSDSEKLVALWIIELKGSVKEPYILIYFFFPPITQSCSVSDVLFTDGRGVSDSSVLKYYELIQLIY